MSDKAKEIQKRGEEILKVMESLSERMSRETSTERRLTLGIEYCELTKLLFDDDQSLSS